MYHWKTFNVILSIVCHHVYMEEEKKRWLYKAVDGRWGLQSQKCVLPYCNYFNLSGKWGKASERSRKKLVKIMKDSNFSSASSTKSLISLSAGDKRDKLNTTMCLGMQEVQTLPHGHKVSMKSPVSQFEAPRPVTRILNSHYLFTLASWESFLLTLSTPYPSFVWVELN